LISELSCAHQTFYSLEFKENAVNLPEKYNDLEEFFEIDPLNEKRFIKWKTAM
jgi:hypothetical protein